MHLLLHFKLEGFTGSLYWKVSYIGILSFDTWCVSS
jgi:hypothetical protein